MTVTVQGELVAASMDLADQVRVALGAFPHQVERGPHSMVLQDIQQARCITRVWTVVEGQGDLPARPVTAEQDRRIAALCRLIKALERGGETLHPPMIPVKRTGIEN